MLEIHHGTAPLIVSMPHTGTEIPPEIERRLVSPWRARKDADWHVEKLYAFARDLGASMIRTTVSRSVIDCNRDPSGASLYPGQATTALCPTTTFDGEPLYKGEPPDADEIEERRRAWFDPYHAAIAEEIGRYSKVVLFDAHSIRSNIPRLFDGELPNLNIGTNSGASCDPALTRTVEAVDGPFTKVVNGRFKGGWTTRHYGDPARGVHAIQLELACRGYMDEPNTVTPENWPTPFGHERSADLRAVLGKILDSCIRFATS